MKRLKQMVSHNYPSYFDTSSQPFSARLFLVQNETVGSSGFEAFRVLLILTVGLSKCMITLRMAVRNFLLRCIALRIPLESLKILYCNQMQLSKTFLAAINSVILYSPFLQSLIAICWHATQSMLMLLLKNQLFHMFR